MLFHPKHAAFGIKNMPFRPPGGGFSVHDMPYFSLRYATFRPPICRLWREKAHYTGAEDAHFKYSQRNILKPRALCLHTFPCAICTHTSVFSDGK